MVLPWENGLALLNPITSPKSLKLLWCCITEADAAKLKAEMPSVEVDNQKPVGEDRLKQFNERVEKLRTPAK